jgi:enoyl-[acyl-carrier-protein] reductase (NADH)
MAGFTNTVPLKRGVSPEDAAGAVTFSCSSGAAPITGQALDVDDGFETD